VLRLALRAGRDLAEAQRIVADPAVAKALQAGYPPGTELRLEARRDRGNVSGAQLEREFLSDPALRRIVKTLDARIERVAPLSGD